jgi:hypothetical protein
LKAAVLALLAAAAGLAGCAAGSTVDRGDYVRANEALYAKLPHLPGARLQSTTSTAYRTTESGPVVGYGTRFDLSLPRHATAATVSAFFLRRLRPEWRLVERLDGPVLNFQKGKAQLSINLDSWRAHLLEVAVDHAGYR